MTCVIEKHLSIRQPAGNINQTFSCRILSKSPYAQGVGCSQKSLHFSVGKPGINLQHQYIFCVMKQKQKKIELTKVFWPCFLQPLLHSMLWALRPRNRNGSRQRCYFVCFSGNNRKDLGNFEPHRIQQLLLCAHIQSLGVFDKIVAYQASDVPDSYKRQFGLKRASARRGAGYWHWKPWIVRHTLKHMQENDLLLYMDVDWKPMRENFALIYNYFYWCQYSDYGMLLFRTDHIERRWTKGDIYAYFGLTDEQLLRTAQRRSGMFYLRKCQHSQDIIEEWYNTACRRPDLFDNSPSQAPNAPDFIKNRHDQAVLSCIITKKGSAIVQTPKFFDIEQNIRPAILPKKLSHRVVTGLIMVCLEWWSKLCWRPRF